MKTTDNSKMNRWMLVSLKGATSRYWYRLEDFRFRMEYSKNHKNLAIGYLVDKNDRGNIYDCVYDPQTMEVLVDDIYHLQAKTPYELFIELELRNAFA